MEYIFEDGVPNDPTIATFDNEDSFASASLDLIFNDKGIHGISTS
jgi:hypothetical protein